MRKEVAKAKSELTGVQQLLTEKEKTLTDNEKNLEQANKAASAARELRRELQFVKVISLSFEITGMIFFYLNELLLFSLQDEMSINQRLKSTLESEVQRAEERISRFVEEKKEMEKLLQEEKKKVEESEKNLNILKETMILMDEQLQVLMHLNVIICRTYILISVYRISILSSKESTLNKLNLKKRNLISRRR